jgi:hypothetical protein
MALDPSAHQVVMNWLQSHSPGIKCQACGNDKWEIGDLVVAFAIADYKPQQPIAITLPFSGGPVMAMVPLCCAHCKNILFFPAASIGLA